MTDDPSHLGTESSRVPSVEEVQARRDDLVRVEAAYEQLLQDHEALRAQIGALVHAAVSTRTIVVTIARRDLGHNPSWVNAADLAALLASPAQKEP